MTDSGREGRIPGPEVMALADGLHRAHAYVEDFCWCRRIATKDFTHDGEQDVNWTSDGTPYDPKDWGETAERPTACEKVAQMLIDHLPPGIRLWDIEGVFGQSGKWFARGKDAERRRLQPLVDASRDLAAFMRAPDTDAEGKPADWSPGLDAVGAFYAAVDALEEEA